MEAEGRNYGNDLYKAIDNAIREEDKAAGVSSTTASCLKKDEEASYFVFVNFVLDMLARNSSVRG